MGRQLRRYLCLLLGVILLAGCSRAAPPRPPFPADVTRYNSFEDPIRPRRFAFAAAERTTPDAQQAIQAALEQRGWRFDPAAPETIVRLDWGMNAAEIAPRLRPVTRQHPYSFTSNGIRYQLYQSYTAFEAFPTTVYPLWMTLVIRDTAADSTALPLFDGRVRTALEYPILAEHILPQLVRLVFSTFPGQNGYKQTEQITLSVSP